MVHKMLSWHEILSLAQKNKAPNDEPTGPKLGICVQLTCDVDAATAGFSALIH